MLTELFGNKTAARVLLFLHRFGKTSPTPLSRELGVPLNMVQKQLARFERGGILASVKKGPLRLYGWNPLNPLRKDLQRILSIGVNFEDPADGTYLPVRERISVVENLSREALRLSRLPPFKPFARSFESFEAYEAWKKREKNPWFS